MVTVRADRAVLQAWQEGWASPSCLQHELIKLRSVGMNGAWEPDAVLCREVVITWNSVWGMIYFEVFGSRKFTDDF